MSTNLFFLHRPPSVDDIFGARKHHKRAASYSGVSRRQILSRHLDIARSRTYSSALRIACRALAIFANTLQLHASDKLVTQQGSSRRGDRIYVQSLIHLLFVFAESVAVDSA